MTPKSCDHLISQQVSADELIFDTCIPGGGFCSANLRWKGQEPKGKACVISAQAAFKLH